MKVWALIVFMWTVPTVEDEGSYRTYVTYYATSETCQASLIVTLKTKTDHMTAICMERVRTSDYDCERVIGWMRDCPETD